ncbi:right-handed parallel beta-helix repeat-containing protein [Natronococcus wangiae]|uniref:right-handed parallel beta-helix repeat-containing protein n=1 Tax=Natronococcus wangiae TaxID=3068275 RepID=UPI00273F35D2|nr:right-handed parallel beta-helix repeat-containing protein [Natronococcus sp. AD5]
MENGSKPSEQVNLCDSHTGGRPNERTTNETKTEPQSRRSVLRGTAVAGLSALGVTGAASGSAAAYHGVVDYENYDNVVNVAAEGADRTGSESITPILEDLRADDTALYFPEGRYYMDSQFRFTRYDNFGIVGDNATLVPANYYDFDGPRYRLFRLGTYTNPGGKLQIRGFNVDQTAPNTGIRGFEAYVTDELDVEDIVFRGEHDSGTWGPALFNVVDPSGTGRVVDFYANDGGEWADSTPHAGNTSARGPVGINATQNEGKLMFRRCQISGFPGSGLYATGGSGQIIVHGGVYRNSTSASIRIGGTDSIIRWPQIFVDESNGRNTSQRGVRFEHGDVRVRSMTVNVSVPRNNCHPIAVLNSAGETTIENATVNISGDSTQHGIVVSPKAGPTTIADTEINHEVPGGYPLWIRDSDSNDPVVCKNLTINGRSGTKYGFRDGIRCERDNCTVVDSEIIQPGADGADRVGIINKGDNFTLKNTKIRASLYPVSETTSESLYADIDAESYGSRSAVCLYDTCSDLTIKNSRIIDGVADFGATGVTMYGNTT